MSHLGRSPLPWRSFNRMFGYRMHLTVGRIPMAGALEGQRDRRPLGFVAGVASTAQALAPVTVIPAGLHLEPKRTRTAT